MLHRINWLLSSMFYLCMSIFILCLRNLLRAHMPNFIKVRLYLFGAISIFLSQSPRHKSNFKNWSELHFWLLQIRHCLLQWVSHSIQGTAEVYQSQFLCVVLPENITKPYTKNIPAIEYGIVSLYFLRSFTFGIISPKYIYFFIDYDGKPCRPGHAHWSYFSPFIYAWIYSLLSDMENFSHLLSI